MDWKIEALCLILFTDLTGSILLLIWYVIGKRLERAGYFNILHRFLRMVILFFLIPITYFILRETNERFGVWYGCLFLQTPLIQKLSNGIVYIWLLGVTIISGIYIVLAIGMKWHYRKAFSCDREIQSCFENVCSEMRIDTRRIHVVQCYEAQVPFIEGVIRPRIVLPDKQFSGNELRTILIHELTHFRNRDLLIKRMVILIEITQWFNPVVWWLHHIVQRWSEYVCDYYACEIVGGMKTYFHAIAEIVLSTSGVNNLLSSHLLEDSHELERRIARMKAYKGTEKKTRRSAAIVSIFLCMISMICVCLASTALADGYVALYRASDVMVEEAVEEEGNVVEFEEEYDDDFSVEIGEISLARDGALVNFNWTLASKVRKETVSFEAEVGESIYVSVSVLTDGASVKFGIVTPEGIKRYVVTDSNLAHTFAVNVSGAYRIFVENNSDLKITVGGIYRIP